MSTTGGGAVVPLRLRPEKAQAIIREAARETDRIILSGHALQRMERRDISDVEVYRLLQCGFVMAEPTRTKYGEWKCKVVAKIRGQRETGAITIIMTNGKLFVKTIEWEDWR